MVSETEGSKDKERQQRAGTSPQLGQHNDNSNDNKCCQGEKIKVVNGATQGVLEIKQGDEGVAAALLTSPALC